MSVSLNIPEREYPFIKSVYEQRYKELNNQLKSIHDEVSHMTPILIQLGIIKENKTEPFPDEDIPLVYPDGYNRNWKWLDKIQFILEKSEKPMTSVEIAEEVLKREPHENRVKVLNSIPATLSVAIKSVSTFLTRKTNKNGEFEYLIDDNPF